MLCEHTPLRHPLRVLTHDRERLQLELFDGPFINVVLTLVHSSVAWLRQLRDGRGEKRKGKYDSFRWREKKYKKLGIRVDGWLERVARHHTQLE